jgi:hypothetical protein
MKFGTILGTSLVFLLILIFGMAGLGNQTVGSGDRLRLDRAAVETILGDKEQLPKGTTVAKGGIHPDELASMLGYNSGQKMLRI